jgi:hypothetical protein
MLLLQQASSGAQLDPLQLAELIIGGVLLVGCLGLAVIVQLRPDTTGGAGCFVWVAGWVMVLIALGLFASAGIKGFQ